MSKTIFISYSKVDVEWKDRLRRFLKPLNIWNEATVWADDCIDEGADWFEAIKIAINDSAVAIMLISTDFLGTEFIAKEEVPELLRLRRERGLWVIPVLIHGCPWNSIRWLKQLSIIPPKAKPLDRFKKTEQDDFLSDLANQIADFLEEWQELAEPQATEAPITATIDISRLPETSAALFGRDKELDALDADWENPDTRVVALVAVGGVGKSALVNRWLRDVRADGWRGAERVFGWSFYSQGARDQAATAEMFIDKALRFFGDPDPEQGSSWDKGERLARLVAARRTLLVLDGMEPLQSSHVFERGRLRDPGLQALLRGLVRESHGLCLISTREPVPDLTGRDGYRAVDLNTITPQDGRALLRSLRVVGADVELETLAEAFGPLALSVTLLGTWLYEQPGHAAANADKLPPDGGPLPRILAGFEAMLGEGPALDLLRVQGYFDRPAPSRQVAAALGVEVLDAGALERLRNLHLLAPHSRHAPDVLEAHPLIRTHYADGLRNNSSEQFQEGHRRLYEHLCETTEHRPDTLAELQPLYQAVRHGCLAGMTEEARRDMYRDRILRGKEFYSTSKLGAIGADLGAVACFFEEPWSRFRSGLSDVNQAWLLNEAATRLHALGRLTDALEPIRAALEISREQENWINAAIGANNLSELELTLGLVDEAVAVGKQAIDYADRSGNLQERMAKRATLADALHQAGKYTESLELFREAEAMQIVRQSKYPLLYSLFGFRYCDLLLAPVEREAAEDRGKESRVRGQKVCVEVKERAVQTLEWAKQANVDHLSIVLDQLTLARVELYEAILDNKPIDKTKIEQVPDVIRNTGFVDYLPYGLLTRAWARFVTDDESGSREDLDEAWEIAERGAMKLHMADVQLCRARFFRDPEALESATALIKETGYHRRKKELEDARKMLGM